jgi:hypothetical protein
MLSCRPKIVAAFLGVAVVALSTASASALPPLRFHYTEAANSGNLTPSVLQQGTIELLNVVGSGRFSSPSDVIVSGAGYIVGALMPQQGTFLGGLRAAGNGHIQDDRWKHKHYEKLDENPPSDLPEPPTLWLFGAGLAVLILFALRKRLAR